MTTSTFLGIPHTGHDRTDGWVHKGKHWLEHTADEAGDTLDKGANEIVDTAVAAVHARCLWSVQTRSNRCCIA